MVFGAFEANQQCHDPGMVSCLCFSTSVIISVNDRVDFQNAIHAPIPMLSYFLVSFYQRHN